MWGVPNAVAKDNLKWDPSNNAAGVPALIAAMNASKDRGFGYQDWRLPSRAELDTLLARGPASQSATQFLFSLSPQWDRGLQAMGLAEFSPYIWTNQPAGIPSWDGSPAIPCKYFNSLAAGDVTITTFTGYLHTAVGPLTNSGSGYPANYRNYNRPPSNGPIDGNIKEIHINVKDSLPLQQKIDAGMAVLKDDIAKAIDRSELWDVSQAAVLVIRNTGDVNYLPSEGNKLPALTHGSSVSARNQLRGTVKSVKLGTVMAEVVVQVGENEIVSAITRGSAEQLGLSEGTPITVIIKATEVLLSTDSA